MKIDNSGKPLASNLVRSSQSRSAATSKRTDVPQQESASLSPQSSAVQVQSSVGSQSAFDTEKVATIRRAITEGKFTVRADAVADKLVDSVRELLAN